MMGNFHESQDLQFGELKEEREKTTNGYFRGVVNAADL